MSYRVNGLVALASLLVAPVALLVPAESGAQRATHEVAGRVVDSAGVPLAESRVRLVELGRAQVTGADGRFRFSAVAPGAYTLSVARLGRVPETRRVAVPGAGD